MASPAELMQTVSAATGVPLATITDLDRRLVRAHLRTKGGRGLNAARMTPLDCEIRGIADTESEPSRTAVR
jgi:hypothetical protein